MEKKPYSDSRWYDNPGTVFSQCGDCSYYHGFGKCDAYPDGIPPEIARNKIIHDKPYEGDHGIQFKKGKWQLRHS